MALHIHLLGNFSVEDDGKPIHALERGRLQSVLAYLLLYSHVRQSRQQIAFQLWPDSTEQQAHSNLRKAVHQLRHALPDADRFLHVDARSIQWRADAPYTLDLDQFTALLHQAASLTTDPGARRALLAEAVALYRGDLLTACYDDWIMPARERVRQQFSGALEQLVWLAEEAQDYNAAIDVANRLLRHDPLHEPAYGQLMRCHALNGDRAGALRVYHTCVSVVQRELGVAPGPEMQAAYARLLEMEAPTAFSSPLPNTYASERLVGRQSEWQLLRSAWQTVARAQAHFCLISGEAGIGKTRLAEELLAWVERQGIATARTRSYAAAGGLAYTPVIEWLRSNPLQATLNTLDKVWLTEIARLLPELLVERPALPRPEPLGDRWQRQRLFEALARAFTADRRPQFLLIDDLQWCDPDTLEWVRYLLHFARHTQLLIVSTARGDEIDPDHPLNALLLDLRSTEQVTEIALGPLNAAESAELAAQMAGAPLNEATAHYLYAQTAGNPLFIVETVRAAGRDWRVERGESLTVQSPISRLQSLPPKMQAVIQQRLAQLSPAARDLAALAATIGRSFTFDLLIVASEREESAVIHSLDELWRRRIVREQGVQTYDFSHDRIREVAYGAISPVQRPILHRRVARALEQVYGDDLDAVSAQLAAQHEQAGAPVPALHYYQCAAELAGARYDHIQKIEFLNASLRLLRAQPKTPERVHRELSLLLAKANSLSVHSGVTVMANLAFPLWLLGYPGQAQATVVEAVVLAERTRDPYVHMVVSFFDSLLAQYRYDLEQAAEAAEHLLALDALHGIPLNYASGVVPQGWVSAQQGKLQEGIAQMRTGIDQMIAMNHTMFQTHRLAWLAEAQLQAGLLTDAAATLEEGFAMAESSGQRSGDAELHRLQGELLVAQGRLIEAEASFHQAIDLARTQEAKSFELRAVMGLCRLWQRQGRQAEAHARLAEIYGWFTEGFATADLQAAKALLAALA